MYAEHFSVENIPFGIASNDSHPEKSVATRFEDSVLFLDELVQAGLLDDISEDTKKSVFQPTVNAFAALPKAEQKTTRTALQTLITKGIPTSHLHPITTTTLHLPLAIGNFTDFSCSRDHVLNAGEAVMGKREVPPGFEYFPIGYTGRASSVRVSGTNVRRPKGQYKDASGEVVYGECKRLDYEVEMAAVVGRGSELGDSVHVKDADEYIFGVVLLNDWSARDIQGLEMNPLGPMNGKSFGTLISPWIITLDALSAFKSPAPVRNSSITLAPYLQDSELNSNYNVSITATVESKTLPSTVVCETNLNTLYWTLRDMVAHQTSNGCSLTTGDLLATGTISGTTKESHGCLLEMVKKGGVAVKTSDGEGQKIWLDDGDIVRMVGVAGPGVGFGECVGMVLPSS